MFLFNRAANEDYDNLDVAGYRQQFFDAKADHVLVDVRTVQEFSQGHIPGAVNIPLDQLAFRAHELPQEKPVVVVCATGNRSRTGASVLTRAGFTEVYNLKGGTMRWMMHRLPLES